MRLFMNGELSPFKGTRHFLSCGVMREPAAVIYLHYTEFVLNHR